MPDAHSFVSSSPYDKETVQKHIYCAHIMLCVFVRPGVGYEIAAAEALGKPILCLYVCHTRPWHCIAGT